MPGTDNVRAQRARHESTECRFGSWRALGLRAAQTFCDRTTEDRAERFLFIARGAAHIFDRLSSFLNQPARLGDQLRRDSVTAEKRFHRVSFLRHGGRAGDPDADFATGAISVE